MPSATRPQLRPPTAASVPKTLRDAWLLAALEREKLVAPDALQALRQEAPEWVAAAVVAKSLATAEAVTAAAAKAAHVPVADLAAAQPSVAQFVPEAVARQFAALPLGASNRVIRIATANPLDLDAEQSLGFVAGRQVEFHYAPPQALFARIDDVYRPERSLERLVGGLGPQATVAPAEEPKPVPSPAAAADAPAARLVEAAIADAVRERATDIVFEPTEPGLVIRYRVDGVLKEVMRVPRSGGGPVIRRLKALARLETADPHRAHEGRATAQVDGKGWDLLVSTAPVARYGEQVTVRLTDPMAAPPTLAALGLWPDELASLQAVLTHRKGIVLWAGPHGSGKVLALHAALQHIRATGADVATVEGPIAYHLPGVKQFAVDANAGMSFGAALRSALKGGPAVVLVSNLRDGETVAAAWEAASDGRLILSTLRTADLASALPRLQSLGIDAKEAAAGTRAIITQRLVRRRCPRCAEPGDAGLLPHAARLPQSFERPIAIRKPKGCAQCGFSGYNGRLVIQELLAVDGAVKELIASGASAADITQAGRRCGMRTLWEAGLRRVWAGETSYDELVRVVGEPSPAAAPAPAEPAPARKPTTLVLVADDDPAMRALMSTILTAQEFQVAEAVDGAEALDQAQRMSPAILLLDMEMPRLNGFGVLEALRKRLAGRSVPVIVVTARDDPDTEAKCIELGAEDYLTKPVQPSSLIVRIRAVLRRVGEQAAWPKS
jgi:type II secretory ATPase GspE/PulE/Tfp pilus assembly ATPase PilB-like protein/ActR/RegA family two-component response regulator